MMVAPDSTLLLPGGSTVALAVSDATGLAGTVVTPNE
jgi:hypothetical protein